MLSLAEPGWQAAADRGRRETAAAITAWMTAAGGGDHDSIMELSSKSYSIMSSCVCTEHDQ